MRLSRRKPQRSDFEVVITSMLDINFLLILFFIMTAHFQRETHALLNLPKERGEKQAQIDEAGLVININAAGRIIVAQQEVSMEELRSRVQAEIERLPEGTTDRLKLMVRADRNASTQDLNRVLGLLRELGVGAIRLATEVPM